MEFLNLLDITLETSLLIALIGSVNRLLRKRLDPNIRYALWIFVALRLLLPMRIDLAIEVPDLSAPAAQHTYNSQPESMDMSLTAQESLINVPIKYTVTAAPPQLPLTAGTGTVTAGQSDTGISLKSAVQLVWVAGMVAVSVYVLASNRKLFLSFRQKRQKIEVLPGGIPLYAMPGYNCLAGILNPAIYIDPEALGNSTVAQNVISHELQHYRVRDHYWQFLRVLCLILQWHNPLMWWAYFASRRDCEMACDARVTRGMTSEERYGYGSSLLAVAESVCLNRRQAVFCSTPMGGSKSFMRERIRGIMQYKYRYALGLLAVAAGIAVIGCFASFHLYAAAEKDREPIVRRDPVETLPINQPEETASPQEKALALNIQDFYSTRIGDPSNLYYIDEDSVLWGCGGNEYGQLGQGTKDYDFHKDMVKIAENVIHVDYDQYFTIFLTADHKLYGMGCANTGAMLEYEEFTPEMYLNPTLYTVESPKLLMENVVYARRGHGDVVCLLEDGSVWTWGLVWHKGFDGWNNDGWHFVPKPEKILDDAVLITGGWYNHAALLSDGSVWTWGYNYAGSCGYMVIL